MISYESKRTCGLAQVYILLEPHSLIIMDVQEEQIFSTPVGCSTGDSIHPSHKFSIIIIIIFLYF